MSRHEGVSCDSCLKGNFRGRRYKCLICYDYDLCATCYEAGATTTRHTTEHPMQCILTRSDFDLYYGGEALTVEQPQAFTCPYCGKMGFTETTLQEHVASEHSDTSFEVVCPVCASLPGGDPNLVTDDFAGHLTLEHRSGPRDLDEPAGSRHGVRRVPHPSRGVGGPRARRSNMHFSSSGGLSSLSPSSRDSVDPIAELLSQLSGVRRSAAGQGSTPTQLQQLQMQLQLERQQAARQQLERLPRRQTQAASSSANSAGPVTAAAVVSGATGGHIGAPQDSAPQTQGSSQFLLSRCMDTALSDAELQSAEQERADRSLFVQELVLATLAEGMAALLPEGLPNKEQEEAGAGPHHTEPPVGARRPPTPPQQIGSAPQHRAGPPGVKRAAARGGGNSKPGQGSSSVLAPAPAQHELRGSGSVRGGPVLAPVRVLTGTGTIREVVGGYGGRGGPVRGGAGVAGSPGPTRRKPVRPIDGRNQSTEPPPPH